MSTAPLPQWRDDWALFLDVDGTLLEIAATPAGVSVPARTLHVLARLSKRLSGAIALVSGRTIADLDRLFGPLRLPTAGAHGAELRMATGQAYRPGERIVPNAARTFLHQWVAANVGALLEDKGAAIALHYRCAPELEAEARRVAAAATLLAGPQFRLQEGKKVLEITPRATDKGRAIAVLMREPPFAGRIPVFVGDDLTDEHGFERVNALGGHSIAVGAPRATVASWRIANEARVLDWLESFA